ncbi:VirB3 family type IV secretion system protein [uncultured Erythrobacter sp.]|uniref:VirB3 family type IV secretion system protein n=1 Tax=uncultured Erythrobacter sp. TaxID=263913 RepID=UPI002613BA73|nr:VirB3 family type IV secretion system protein [uncultured Erythrobacter sp.]
MTDPRANIDGFTIPLHRALTEPILLAGAPRTVAIINGTLAAAVGLGLRLWVPGLLLWLIGHGIAVSVAKRDPRFLEALVRHVRHKAYLSC